MDYNTDKAICDLCGGYLEKCLTHGWVKRDLHQSADHIKATCSICGAYIKFISPNDVQEFEIIHKASPLF